MLWTTLVTLMNAGILTRADKVDVLCTGTSMYLVYVYVVYARQGPSEARSTRSSAGPADPGNQTKLRGGVKHLGPTEWPWRARGGDVSWQAIAAHYYLGHVGWFASSEQVLDADTNFLFWFEA